MGVSVTQPSSDSTSHVARGVVQQVRRAALPCSARSKDYTCAGGRGQATDTVGFMGRASRLCAPEVIAGATVGRRRTSTLFLPS